ncbi:MAG: replication initiation factor domain-containing protein [Lactobacillus sp.]|nr:replication initiation factor domain-containing protein [Lactobacillus sp.]
MENYVFFDYFTYTVRIKEIQDIFELMGVDEEIFQHTNSGKNHYTHTYSFENVFRIMYCEMDERSKDKYLITSEKAYEVNINMTGRIIREFSYISSFSSCFEMLNELRKSKYLLAPINFTRVDFTKDDKDGLLDLDVLERKASVGQVATRFSATILKSMQDKDTRKYYGKTIYFGSKDSNSEFFIRIYNKSAEQYAKKLLTESSLEEHHTRVEMVFKKAVQANKLMEKVFTCYEQKQPVGVLYSEILVGKLKILKNGKKPGQRYEENIKNLDSKYKKFLDSTKKQTLGVETATSTIETKIDYYKKMDKLVAMIYDAMGEEEFVKMTEVMLQTGRAKRQILEQKEVEEYKKRNSDVDSERVPEELVKN